MIAATNVDLREEVRAGRFGGSVLPPQCVPDPHRAAARAPEDIPLLMTHFLTKFNRLHGRHLTGFTQRAVDAMLSYDWPGNVREIENVIERGAILAPENGAIDSPHLFGTEWRTVW